MKGILRTFDLVSGLKINFNKSLIIGIGVEEEWLDKMAWIMCCKKGNLPFKYLGIPIGGSCRKISFWKPLVEVFHKKLTTWKGRFLSLGGRITLINSVLSSLPVFWMSMYLILKGTILSLDKIRRRFLWGGIEGGKKINWVKWDTVCKDKELGGLGVKDLRKFNLALLAKWWGRLVNKDKGLWKKVIVEKYGKEGEPSYNWLRENIGYGSTWWRDICRLNNIECKHEGWLVEGFKIRVGDGGSIKFWWDEWCGEGQLANRFPRLYLLSAGKDFKVSQSRGWLNGTWIWHLEWRKGLHSWEEQEVSELMKMINDITITRGKEDIWEWSHSKDGDYSSKSAYQALKREHGSEQQQLALHKVWNSIVPNKISAFSWQVLQDKIPTKINLIKRGITQGIEDGRCDLCGSQLEEASHLFIHCSIAHNLWNACFRWWGIKSALDKDCLKVFRQHSSVIKMAGKKEGWSCIWFAVVWTLWLARNERIFRGKEEDENRLLKLVQLRAFSWIKCRSKSCTFSLSDWFQNPLACLKN
ncbi:hypothetical protein SLEP1_g33961 [Rubroshorea leprosula]|uniref:C2H2-type domain-containing protein n=1 Tax=Rubroshorea leprosula TaxID=152421 RepID=A0AAV5KID6_9ROSI|nr:hypothetical protein SLEP1_g33961 [Rubroshorea leprosula]